MALRTLVLAASLFSAGFAAPLDSSYEGGLEQRQSCSAQWGQCGGQGWTGPTCCQSGSTCVKQHDFYSQCLPGSSQPSSTTSSSVIRTTTTAGPTSTTAGTATTTIRTTTTTAPNPGGSGTATYTGNPYSGVNLWANKYYSSEVHSLAIPQLSGAMATAAAKVADVPSYMWMDTFSKIALVDQTLADIRAANKAGGNYAAQLVVYDLPDRDCAAAASNGEYSIADGGEAKYRNYIDNIRTMLIKYSDIRTLLVIEPDSLANMVTNLNVAKCANAADVYHRSTVYAVKQLDLPNVAQYLDAGHAGWLGWPANQPGAADVFSKVFIEAGKPKSLRGLATNVSNYNAWSLSSAPSYTTPNPVYDEKKFIEALGPQLESKGWTGVKFIIDQGRSGKQPTGQLEWGHWCNALGTGFGPRPSTNTGSSWADAFVWVKPGGESDGTSDRSAVRFDTFCGLASAMQPSPEAGTWHQNYFVQLLQNANPSFL